MIRWLADRVNLWVMVAAAVVAVGLIILAGILLFMMPGPTAPVTSLPAQMTIIPAPSPTATQPRVFATSTPTKAPVVGGISVGSYVQISGTQGVGLRLREGAGTNKPMRFVGMDSEVFLVKEGPKEADGITWWYLEAPYDAARSGWAAGNYLTVVEGPVTPTQAP